MKRVNILSIIQAFSSLKQDSYKCFLRHYGIGIKDDEVNDLESLAKALRTIESDKRIFDQFYIGYKIPQISKEFDLLRFGEGCVVNIELKRSATKEKIEKQLKRNKYYLSFLEKEMHFFSFVSKTSELFYLNSSDQLEAVDFSRLISALKGMQVKPIDNIDSLFNPSNYLVSPFNSTQKFVNNEYFLTVQQETIVREIISAIDSSASATYISIKGSAGTGKTLLVYDIAKSLREAGKKPLIIHCGYLNDGQLKLKGTYQWHITQIKDFGGLEFSDYDLVIIDEAQRIYKSQLLKIIEKINIVNGKCIFSYDKLQTLAAWEENSNIDGIISSIPSILTYKLTEKIRTNKEIATFIKLLFNNKTAAKLSTSNNIELNFFDNEEDAKDYLSSLSSQGWDVLRFTPSQYNKEHHQKYSDVFNENSHKVIGQEFDSVAVTIDSYFNYDTDGDLIYTAKAFYDPVKMLFQNITRTRKRLNIILINNSVLFDRCASVLEDQSA
ncbi:MAG: DUF2075 domain-containing protein [Gammaproteobacteria bacterium]|nr:DUF2075 domain-containing protein [Gammaproteobacteria bacterium]MBU1602515.1 DUF2075 domain-containing protein [Gammaproteobacteria bacterium]MBU2433320.1 DUF2075 domain-containing protein [Gammaproteobacteria bacterium]MBU2451236.1 DUF2075 domain-containing protein [Gammaproteobacteria bacterium]